jgi:Zn-dependent protease
VGDLTTEHVVLRIAALLLIASVHGFVVAGLACLLGDQGPRYDGRLSLSPWRHADPIGGGLMVLFTTGWIRPVAIDPRALHAGRGGLVIVILGAAAATVALAMLARMIRPVVMNLLPDTMATVFFVFVETLTQLCLTFALFNLLPVPPLTGQHWLVAIQPAWREAVTRLQLWFVVPLALLIGGGVAARLLAPGLGLLNRFVSGE